MLVVAQRNLRQTAGGGNLARVEFATEEVGTATSKVLERVRSLPMLKLQEDKGMRNVAVLVGPGQDKEKVDARTRSEKRRTADLAARVMVDEEAMVSSQTNRAVERRPGNDEGLRATWSELRPPAEIQPRVQVQQLLEQRLEKQLQE